MCEYIDTIKLNFSPDKLILLNLLLAFLMFGISLSLKTADFKRIIDSPRKAIAGCISQYLVLPLVTYLLVIVVNPCPSIALGIFLLGSCPGGNMSNFLSSLAKGNVALSVTLSVFQTVLAPLMTPITFALCAGNYGPTQELMRDINVNTSLLIQEILIILGIPLLIGFFVSNRLPKITEKIIKPVQIISLTLFIGFLIFSFVSNYSIFIQIIGSIFFLVLFHNGLAMLGGYATATLFRLDFKDKKCLAIETGIINAALGLGIIFSFFGGLGGMAVVAGWWGLWDLIAGFTIATIWARMDAKRLIKEAIAIK